MLGYNGEMDINVDFLTVTYLSGGVQQVYEYTEPEVYTITVDPNTSLLVELTFGAFWDDEWGVVAHTGPITPVTTTGDILEIPVGSSPCNATLMLRWLNSDDSEATGMARQSYTRS